MAPDLPGFTLTSFSDVRKERPVYRAGEGPAVIVIAEAPGITPAVMRFARRVVDAGFTAVLPVLFGTPGADVSRATITRTFLQVCVSREFGLLATHRSGPVTDWLRALARHEHEVCGGPGAGAVGMCLTGGFALAMSVDDAMLAPVLSQPAVPVPLGSARRSSIGMTDEGLARIRDRCAAGELRVLGLRFTGDKTSPPERFATLRRELGDNFTGVEIDSSAGNPHGIPANAHSVLTEHLVDEPGHPTHDALGQVLAFLQTRLLVPAGPSAEPR
jgi:dienelactone hydrolase